MPKMIVLTGLPGSGKSTICNELFPHFHRVNQDKLGSRDKCIEEVRHALEANADVIVDRVNHTKAQRKFWIDLAHGYGVSHLISVFLDVNPDECVARIHARRDHETIKEEMEIEKKRLIVYNFFNQIELPTLTEGFSTLIFQRN